LVILEVDLKLARAGAAQPVTPLKRLLLIEVKCRLGIFEEEASFAKEAELFKALSVRATRHHGLYLSTQDFTHPSPDARPKWIVAPRIVE
jgi:hypothetical protein